MDRKLRNTYLGTGITLTALVALSLVLLEPRLIGFDQDFVKETLVRRHLLRLVVLSWFVFVVWHCFVVGVVRNGRIGPRWKNVLTSAFAVFFVLMLLEAVFMFVPHSHGNNYTYASQTWFAFYWRTNELGYRDKPVSEIDQSKPLIAVVGDSFAAGHGIRSPHDTFAGQLRKMVGGRFTVVNLGRNRADTGWEFNNLRNYPFTPDVVVLQYYGNDIDPVAVEAGIPWGKYTPYEDINLVGEFMVRGSALLNYIYWQFPHQNLEQYIEFLVKAYKDPKSMNVHFHDLERFVKYAEDCQVPLLVVLFPFLRDTELSHIFTDPIGEFFRHQGVPVIEVAELLQSLSDSERVVNTNNSHPSITVHHRVAEAIWAKLNEIKSLGRPSQCRETKQ